MLEFAPARYRLAIFYIIDIKRFIKFHEYVSGIWVMKLQRLSICKFFEVDPVVVFWERILQALPK